MISSEAIVTGVCCSSRALVNNRTAKANRKKQQNCCVVILLELADRRTEVEEASSLEFYSGADFFFLFQLNCHGRLSAWPKKGGFLLDQIGGDLGSHSPDRLPVPLGSPATDFQSNRGAGTPPKELQVWRQQGTSCD